VPEGGASRQTGLPVELVVHGVPVSVQSRATASMDRWQRTVAAVARAALPRRRGADLAEGRLAATLVYFYLTPPLDTDNMIKPILDAMKGIVFEDDQQIVDLHAGVREMRGAYDLDEVSNLLWSALDAGDPFVYVRVDAAPDPLEALP
jgi:crossover junction endodeoxyribonuclease RusA